MRFCWPSRHKSGIGAKRGTRHLAAARPAPGRAIVQVGSGRIEGSAGQRRAELDRARMTLSKSCWAGVIVLTALCAFQRPFRVYPSLEPYDDVSLPPDWQQKAEWIFARLMYPPHPNARFGRWSRRMGGSPDWREGGTSWTQDYPRADRH